MKICVICSYPFEDNGRLTCSDRCMIELENRRMIAAEKRKLERELLANKPRCTMVEIVEMVVGGMAIVLLERNIPYFISNTDLDVEMCMKSDKYGKMSRAYRKRCISKNIGDIGYITHATSTHGRKTFRLVGDRDVIRTKLESLSMSG